MKEQLLNLLYILPVMLPLFLGGVMVRFSRRSRTDGWRVTAISAAVSVLVWLAVLCLNRGSELLGAIAYAVTGFPVGAAVCGLGLRLQRADR